MDQLSKDSKIVMEDAKKVVDLIDRVDIEDLMKAFVDFLDIYADLAIKMGELEKKNPEAFIAMQNLGKAAPEFMKKLADSSPPAELGTFIKAFFDLLTISDKLSNIMTLPPDEKIAIGIKIQEITKVLNKMIKKYKKKTEQLKDE